MKEDYVVRGTVSMSHVIMEEIHLAHIKCWVNTKVFSWMTSFRISLVEIQGPILSECPEATELSEALSWKSISNSYLLSVIYVIVHHQVFGSSPKVHVSGSCIPSY